MGDRGMSVEDLDDGEDSRARLEAGELKVENNIWWNIGDNTLAGVAPGDSREFFRNYLSIEGNNNSIVDPMLAGISREAGSGMLDPRPNLDGQEGAAWTNSTKDLTGDSFFTNVDYLGAFGEMNWLDGWTNLDFQGYLGNLQTISSIEPDATPGQSDFFAYPNPATVSTDVRFILNTASNIHLAVYNQMGELVEVLGNDYFAAGTYRSTWNVSSVVSGMYFVKLETNYGTFTQKVIVK